MIRHQFSRRTSLVIPQVPRASTHGGKGVGIKEYWRTRARLFSRYNEIFKEILGPSVAEWANEEHWFLKKMREREE